MAEATHNFYSRLPADLWSALEFHAAEFGVTKNAVAIDALRHYLTGDSPQLPGARDTCRRAVTHDCDVSGPCANYGFEPCDCRH